MENIETGINFTTYDDGHKDKEKISSEEIRVESLTDYVIDRGAEERLVKRIDLRFMPASMIVYLFSILDRSNIGNAKLLNSDTGDSLLQVTHMTNKQYLIALFMFIIAYAIFEIPSNYLLKKFRPSRWIAFLTFTWGVMTMILGAVHSFSGVVVVRFILGAFEAGLFPGMVYCTTFWYKPQERTLRVALILAAATLGGAFGGAIAFAVGHMNGLHGLQAWRWLFIIEGAPPCVAAFFIFLFYPDYPETDQWLSAEERELAIQRMKGVGSVGHHKLTWKEGSDTLKDWRLYLHYVAFISIAAPFSSISLFTPTIVSGLGYEGLDAQLFTVPPYAIAFVVTITIGWLADRYEMRGWGAFIAFSMSGIGFLVLGSLPPTSFKARYATLCVAVSFSFGANAPLVGWLTANLHNTGALTLAIPLNVSLSHAGQIVGVYIYKDSEAPGYPTGHYTNAAFGLEGAIVVLILRMIYIRRNRKLKPGERAWRL